jgi:threonine dehydratase
MLHGLTAAGRYLVVRTRLPDRPGELIKLLELVAEERGNVVSVEHHREGMNLPISQTEVELTLATRDDAHCEELLRVLGERGYAAERLS